MGIFKACDIRGVYGQELTDEAVYRIGRAVGTLTKDKVVIVGGDVRTSTPALKDAVIRGLTESGVSVLDVGTVPTPVFYFARHHYNIDAGIMVTASHNPPEFNGLKLILGPLPITEEELGLVRRLAESGEFSLGAGSIQTVDVTASYISFIQSVAPGVADAQLPEIIVDCGNGCFSGLAPEVFRSLGYRVGELFCLPDGTFPNRSPNSAMPGNLVSLCRSVRDTGAHLGVAFDGDGDRVAFVDDRGRFLISDKAIVILARHVLARNPGSKVVYDLKSSSVVSESVAQSGGIAVPERSGHTFIKTRMIREGAVFGGEISGHYFYRELHGGDDGLYSALLMAGLLVSRGERLSVLADEVPEYATTPDIRLPFEGDREDLIARIAEAFPAERVSTLDGVRIEFPGGWGLVRASVTEPVLTFRFEAGNPEQLREIVGEFLSPIPRHISDIMKAKIKAESGARQDSHT